MFLFKSENEFVDSFRPVDQKQIRVPQGTKFPLVVRDYFAWTDSSNSRVYLVFSEPDVKKPIGVVFEREHPRGETTAAICEWCHSFGSTNQIGLLTLEVNPKRRVGIHLCLDLSCRDKIDKNLSLTPIAAQERIRQVVEGMSKIVRRFLL